MNEFIVGQAVRLSVEIRNISGVLADPTALSLFLKSPAAEIVEHVGDVVKDAIGKYHFDLSLDDSGTYGYRWQSTGENQGVVEGGIFVCPQVVN